MSFRAVVAVIGLIGCHVAFAAPNQAPTVNITAPAAGSPPLASPATITINANASDSDGTITKVQFFQGTTQIGGDDTIAPYEVTHTFTTPGTYSLTAKATDNGAKTTTSAAVQIQVIMLTTTITAPANNSVVQGRSVGVSGAFTGGDTTAVIVTAVGLSDEQPAKKVFGHSTVASISGSAYGASVALAPGANTVEVQVARRDGTSETASVNVTAVDPPVVAYTSPTSCRAYRVGDVETFAVDAASAQGGIAEVRFFDNGTQAGPTLTSPPYSADITFTAVGNHSITARATDTFGFTATSSALNLNVATAAPVATVSSPTNAQRFRAGVPVTLTATASDSDGSVSSLHYFANNGGGDIRIEGGTTAPYQAIWTPPTYGTYTIRAVAVDNTNVEGTSASISIAVNRAPSVTVTSPANGAQFTAPATIVVSADASDLDGGSITKVQLMMGATLIEEKTAPPYQSTVPNLAAGSYQFSAIAFDNDGDSTQSAIASVTVAAPANQPPTITVTSPANGASFTAPTDITLSATAGDADGTVAKVEFFAGATLLAVLTAPPYSYTWSNPALGSHNIVATATDNAGATNSTSVAISVTGTWISITAPLEGSQYQAPAAYQITAQVATSSGTLGLVEFLDNGVAVANVTMNVSSGTVTYPYSSVGAGNHVHTIRAQHSSGSSHVSAPVTVEVLTPSGISLARPFQNEFFVAPAAVFLRPSLTNVSATVARVDYRANGFVVASSTTSPYEELWPDAAAGTYQVVATLVLANGQSYDSSPVQVLIGTPSVTIDSSVSGSIADDRMRVFGTSSLPTNSAILVNGMQALRDDAGNWVVDNVALQSGPNQILVQGVTIDGGVIEATAAVESAGQKPYVFIASPGEDFYPFTLRLELFYRGVQPIDFSRAEIYFTSGVPDYIADSLNVEDNGLELDASINSPGWGEVRIKVFGSLGLVYEQSHRFLSVDPVGKSRWLLDEFGEVMSRLKLNDVAGGLRRFSNEAKYQRIFSFLGAGLPAAIQSIGTVDNIFLAGDTATIRLVRANEAFPVRMVKGRDGLWRIGGM